MPAPKNPNVVAAHKGRRLAAARRREKAAAAMLDARGYIIVTPEQVAAGYIVVTPEQLHNLVGSMSEHP